MWKWILGGLAVLVVLIAAIAGGAYVTLKRPDIPYADLAAEYESPASRYVDLSSGVRMHYRDEGQSAGAPTLLLIHGFSASLHTWEPWVARLSDTYRIVSLDLPGHGLTSAPADYSASIEVFRDEVHAFTTAMGLQRFALAGSSMGGNVAWEYALAHPEQIEALILVDASGWQETRANLDRDPPVFRLLRDPNIGPAIRDLDATGLTRQGLQASFSDASLVDDAMVSRYVELARAPGHRAILLQMTLGFRERNYATPERLAPLANIPVLVLHGDSDRLVPLEHGRQFQTAIDGAEIIVFENTGHIPQEERPDVSAMAVREFLYRVHEPPALAVAD
ncbi:MAG TPA: alpha/beta hydrolase [Vitreimonas sp.]|uniref:alpha/beta fold hydrolase n=1 Tax=Vitreimonas sp. TaxID=3069702 RepID=UPI002D2DB1D5|nr:alpha/beta hydrolase [Vitreimonas sp.]HYD87389.1 alpha/beta hydrolase [Vitreimonas sp.]